MTQYRIIVTPDAVDDMVELRNYIAEVLCAPNTALSYIRAVRKEIASLSEMPARYKPVDDEPWHSRGIRKFLVKNSFVYYRIDEETGTVYILNIIYSARDQLRALSEMKLD
jgi:toxin ParE1/3/4